MAKQVKARVTDAPPAIPDVFVPDAQYEVRLTRIIEVGGVTIRPYNNTTLKGRVCEANRDALASAVMKA